MIDPRSLVRALELDWQGVLDAVLSPMRRPPLATRDIALLAPKVEELSRAYNMGLAEGRRTKLPLEARVAFSFPRDVPKGAAAVRELVASGALSIPKDQPLRIVDLGAGLGAMTWGLVRALAAAGGATGEGRGKVEALLVDEDEEVLETATTIARAARSMLTSPSPIDLAITTRVRTLGALSSSSPLIHEKADVVLLGQVLSELDPRLDPPARVERHAALLRHLLDTLVSDNGALVVVEPALRERTRILHAVRDRVLEIAPSASVFAPCLHANKCPALAFETEWCHEDLPIDLPTWVAPLARAAGLRWQGLTFSYLVLRKDGRHLLGPKASTQRRLRVISDLLRSKGKTELFACTEEGIRPRLRRLDRDEGRETGVSFQDLARGDIVSLDAHSEQEGGALEAGGEEKEGPIDERGRVKAHVAIDVGAFGEDERLGGSETKNEGPLRHR